MDRELTRQGVAHEFVRIAGGEHGFDHAMQDPAIQRIFAKVLAFLSEHTR
jgi:hypothetical protein